MAGKGVNNGGFEMREGRTAGKKARGVSENRKRRRRGKRRDALRGS